MVEGKRGLNGRAGFAIQIVLQDRIDAAPGNGVDAEGSVTGSLQTFVAIGLGQAQDAERGTVALLGMSARPQDVIDGSLGVGADLGRPVEETLAVPPGHPLMGRRQMRVSGGMPTLGDGARVAGESLALLEDFDRAGGQPQLHLLPGMAVGDGVVMPGRLDVVVDADGGDLPFGKLIAVGPQGLEGGLVDGREDALAGARQFLERTCIQFSQERPDGAIDLLQTEDSAGGVAGPVSSAAPAAPRPRPWPCRVAF